MSLARRLWDMRRERPLFVALSVLTLAALLTWPLVEATIRQYEWVTNFRFYDFGAYSTAVDAAFSGDQIYVPNEDGGYHGSYLYPPVILLFFYPFATFPFQVGAVFLGLTSLFLLWVAVDAVAAQLGYDLRLHERVLLLVALYGFQPQLFDFKMGQVGTMLAAVLAFAFYQHERQHSTGSRLAAFASGALTTLGSSVKLFYATSGAHLLRDTRRFAGAVLAAAGLAVLSVATFGVEVHLNYLNVLLWGKGWGGVQHLPHMGRPAYFRPLYVLGDLRMVAIPLGVLAVIGLTVAARDAEDAARPTFALGVAAILLLAPRAYTQDLPVLLVPALILVAVELGRADGYPWIPVLAVLLLHVHSFGTRLMIHVVGRENAVVFQPGMYATFLLVGLAAVRVAGHATLPASLGGGTETPRGPADGDPDD
ncbi:glycosyltransferase family 87 protein [Halobacteriales archaeon Cl-PHB]